MPRNRPHSSPDPWLAFARWVLSDRDRTRRTALLLSTVLTATVLVVWLLAPHADAISEAVTHLLRARTFPSR
jgi:hypothetical protein